MNQPRIFLSSPHMSGRERELVTQAFDSNYVAPLGPMVDAFEKAFCDYTGFPYAVALNAGTAALHLALRGLGIGAGDVVIASSLTFIGSITPILYQGAVPVFIDSDASWNMDPALLEETLAGYARQGKLPKAVVPTDLYGQSCDIDRLLEICERYGVPLLVDGAESMGATYKGRHAGMGGRAACFSFNGNKIITSSGGGMLASTDKKLIDEARFLSQQARDPAPHYEHTTYGYNYRMSNIVAAIGIGQLEVLDERVAARRANFDYYAKHLALPGIRFMPEAPEGRANRWLSVITVDPAAFGADRETIRLALEKENIEARPVWKPMHLQPLFKDARMVGGAVSEAFFRDGLCLPSGSQMTEADLARVCETVKRCAK